MRRADRLLALMEALRGQPLVRGRELASGLEVSLRTLYRDIAALIRIGVPIRGEAGVGYSLEPGYYLPPLNLTPVEAEMIDFGLRLLQSVGDGSVTERATSARTKIRAVVPRDAQSAMDRNFFSVSQMAEQQKPRHDLLELKRAAENRRVLEIEYVASSGRRSVTTVHPLSLSFIGTWFMIGWCEESASFRCLRLDRIDRVTPTGRAFKLQGGNMLSSFIEQLQGCAKAGDVPGGASAYAKVCRVSGDRAYDS